MKTSFIILAMLLAVPAIRQEVEHAPTAAQCQADQRLWLSQAEAEHGTDGVTAHTLALREHEMGQCSVVDPQNTFKYLNTRAETCADEGLRYEQFLARHHLREQFDREEAASR